MSIDLRVTFEQYDIMVSAGAFDGKHRQRVELIRGEIRPMNPIGALHEVLVDWLMEWSFENSPRKEVRVRVQNSIGLPELESAPEPDVAWVARKNFSRRRPRAEDVFLVIEVADSSLATDLGDKMELYAEAGVRDYWVVDARGRRVTVFREPQNGGYGHEETFALGAEISPLAFPQARLKTAELFAETEQS